MFLLPDSIFASVLLDILLPINCSWPTTSACVMFFFIRIFWIFLPIGMSCKIHHALKEQLTDDQAAALEQIMDETLNLLADELKQNFRNGFCLGVKMMCEVFGKDV